MAVERITPQLVKKGKGKKRPGYRGPGGYQGGGGSSSRSSGPAGGASAGGNYGGNRNSNQSYGGSGQGGATRPNPHTSSGTSKTSKVTAKNIASSKKKFVQNLNHNNAVRAAQTGQKFTPYKGGSRPQGGSLGGLGSLIMSGLGMLMGIPGLGLLTGGLGKLGKGLGSLNDKTQSTDFGRSTSLMDYLDMKKFGGYNEREMARRINMDESKNLQARIDGGGFGGFGTQKPTFSDPFANTVGTTTKVNAPASDAVSSHVPFSNYGKANAATLDGVPLNEALAPTPVEQLRDKAYTGIEENIGAPFSNFLNNLMSADQIAALENEYGSKYGIINTSEDLKKKEEDKAYTGIKENVGSPFSNFLNNLMNADQIAALENEYGSKYGITNTSGDVFEGSTPVPPQAINNIDVGYPSNDLMTELSQKQFDFLNQPINQKSLKDSSFGLTPKQIFDKLPSYEERQPSILNPFKKQEPTTPEEYNQYLDSIGVPRMTAADGGLASMFTRRG